MLANEDSSSKFYVLQKLPLPLGSETDNSRRISRKSNPKREFTLKRYLIICAVLTSAILQTQTSFAQVNTQAQQVSQGSKKISFRQAEWKTLHLEDMAQVESASATLKRIGCEVTQSQHDGHVDLRFRCATWKTMSLETEQQVNQWSKWLIDNGLNTVIRNPPANTTMPTVSYRLPQAVSAHLHDQVEAQQVIEILNMLGCEVQSFDHDGHLDINVQCNEWLTLGVATEDTAHEWQAWLKSNGFETQHTHVKQ